MKTVKCITSYSPVDFEQKVQDVLNSYGKHEVFFSTALGGDGRLIYTSLVVTS